MKAAVIVGASSGIGRELAKTLALNGYGVGLAGRRWELLSDLQAELPGPSYIKRLDVSKPAEAMALLRELIAEMNGVDLFVISAGTGFVNPGLDWQREKETIDVNVSGFAAVANIAAEHLQARGAGHIVGISSLAALRGGGESPAYNASKAFVSPAADAYARLVSSAADWLPHADPFQMMLLRVCPPEPSLNA